MWGWIIAGIAGIGGAYWYATRDDKADQSGTVVIGKDGKVTTTVSTNPVCDKAFSALNPDLQAEITKEIATAATSNNWTNIDVLIAAYKNAATLEPGDTGYVTDKGTAAQIAKCLEDVKAGK